MSQSTSGPVFIATWDFGELAVRTAWEHWQQHGDFAAACVEGTAAVELDPEVPTVGIGGLPNRDGVVELDAGYMRGSDLRCGGVAAVRTYCPVIRLARAVGEKTNQVMLAGRGADDFVAQQGFEPLAPEAMLTDKTRSEYNAWQAKVDAGEIDRDKMVGHDTVCVLGWDQGETIACVATSGLGFKRAGRVGDSPIIGAGLYADDEAGCAASTGMGEELYRHVVSSRATDAMRSGASAAEANDRVMRRRIARDPANAKRGLSLIGIDRHGGIGAATTHTENHQFELHVCRAGVFERIVPTPIA